MTSLSPSLLAFSISLLYLSIYSPLSGLAAETNEKNHRSITSQIAEKDPVNLIMYETRVQDVYAVVAYMPYYPAYGLVSIQSPNCKAEITGFVDPFSLQKNQLAITYKKCRISFNQQQQKLTNPQETEGCQEYHPKTCAFNTMPDLIKTDISTP